MTNRPFFTIITATYNAASTLPRLLQSLAEQTCRNFVWVCQDGASSDETLAVVEEWQDKLPAVSVESKKDISIYDAWNTALTRQGDSLGEWVIFLGADDLLADAHVLEKVKTPCMNAESYIHFICGTLHYIKTDNSHIPYIVADTHKAFAALPQGLSVPFPALFIRKKLFTHYRFDISYKIAADYDWVWAAWKSPQQLQVIPTIVTHMHTGGISNCEQSKNIIKEEKKCISEKRTLATISAVTKLFLQKNMFIIHAQRPFIKEWCDKYKFTQHIWKIAKCIHSTLKPKKG